MNDNSSQAHSKMHRLQALEDQLRLLARSFGQNFKSAPASVLVHLSRLPVKRLEDIEYSLDILKRSFEICAETNTDPWNDLEFFKISMKASGLSYPSDVLGRIKAGDIIEGYDMERRQIFRNIHFMEASSYSLLEILSFDWPTLFERSSHITRLIIHATEEDIWSESRVVESTIPKHFIREILSAKPQVCEIHHKYFAPLYVGPNRPGGFLSVCEGKVIQALPEISKDNVAFI